MKYTNRQYAEALHSALARRRARERKATIRRFFMLLARKGELPRLPRILSEYERISLSRAGFRKVEVESPEKISTKLRRTLARILGRKLVVSEVEDPSLFAGVRIFVDGELFIDASGKRFLREMFLKRA